MRLRLWALDVLGLGHRFECCRFGVFVDYGCGLETSQFEAEATNIAVDLKCQRLICPFIVLLRITGLHSSIARQTERVKRMHCLSSSGWA